MGVDYPARRRPRCRSSGPDGTTGYLFLRALAGLVGGGAFAASPSTAFKGQILTTGHLLHPATMAMGQRVMLVPVNGSA